MKQQDYDFDVIQSVIGSDTPVDVWKQLVKDSVVIPPNSIKIGLAIKQIIADVGKLNRPRLLTRIQGYAAVTLCEEDFGEYVFRPQIVFDFDQLASAAGADEILIDEVVTLRDTILKGNRAGGSSLEFILLIDRVTKTRPKLLGRLDTYLNISALITPTVASDNDAGGSAGGLSANMIPAA